VSATKERDHVREAAKRDYPAALQRARRIADPWYRSQALAGVARFAPDAEVLNVADEAIRAAATGKDPYQQVAAAAWAVRALAERGRMRQASELTARLCRQSQEITPLVSRASALFLLWQAAWPLDPTVRRPVLDRLITACQEAPSWRAGRTFQDALLMLAAEDAAAAQRLLETMPEGRYERQAQRRLGEGQSLTPRTFFW
jgi:hypothetical protein